MRADKNGVQFFKVKLLKPFVGDPWKKTSGMGPGSHFFWYKFFNGGSNQKNAKSKIGLKWPLLPHSRVRPWNFWKKLIFT